VARRWRIAIDQFVSEGAFERINESMVEYLTRSEVEALLAVAD
jgi:hypothetical protein